MGTLNSILAITMSIILLWVLYSGIKNRPELFSANNLNKSFFIMGIIAIILIIVIGFAAIMLAR